MFLIKKRRPTDNAHHWTATLSTNKSSNRSVLYKKLFVFVKISQYSRETPVMKSLLNKVVGPKACKFIKKRPQHRCFPVNIGKFLRTPTYGCFWRDFRKWLFRTYFLNSRFQKHPDLAILQKYQSLLKYILKNTFFHRLLLFSNELLYLNLV